MIGRMHVGEKCIQLATEWVFICDIDSVFSRTGVLCGYACHKTRPIKSKNRSPVATTQHDACLAKRMKNVHPVDRCMVRPTDKKVWNNEVTQPRMGASI